MTRFIFLFLHFLMIFVFFYFGRKMSVSATNRQYWKNSFVAIVTFMVVSGLRFGRDVDYNVYYLKYTVNASQEAELGFHMLYKIMWFFDMPYWIFPLFCSTLLIFSVCLVLQKYKQGAMFALPLMLCVPGIENLIRWYLAVSVLLIGFFYMMREEKKDKIIGGALLLLASQFHYASLMVSLLAMFFHFFSNEKLFSRRILIVLFLIFSFSANTEYLAEIAKYANFLSFMTGGMDKATYYLENAVDVARGGMSTGIYEVPLVRTLRYVIAYSFLIWFGRSVFQEKKDKFMYNIMCFAYVIMPVFNLVEIFNRIAAAFQLFAVLGASVIYYEYFRRFKTLGIFKQLFLVISLFFAIYGSIMEPLGKTNEMTQMLYLWDAGDRNYIPTKYFVK